MSKVPARRTAKLNQGTLPPRDSRAEAEDSIERGVPACVIQGARTHNLKGIDCHIPFGKMTVITGVSGSGKTSLAFDTLYAEGQRRFVDCLSTYARQFLPRLDRPEVDRIGEIQPPVALRQQNLIRNARSTVGTITEISGYLELVFAYAGVVHCASCGAPAETLDLVEAADLLLSLPPEERFVLAAPIVITEVEAANPPSRVKKGKRRATPTQSRIATEAASWSLDSLRAQGHTRFLVDGLVVEAVPRPGTRAWLVIDRLTSRALSRQRAQEAIEAGWRMGNGEVALFPYRSEHAKSESAPSSAPLRSLRRGVHCSSCGKRAEILSPRHFSAQSPLGACQTCQGFGRIPTIERDKVVPDPSKTIRQGAIFPFGSKMGARFQRRLEKASAAREVRIDIPYRELSPRELEWIWDGSREAPNVAGFFRYLERKRYRAHVRIFQARFRGYVPCTDCGGARRTREVLSVKLAGRSIADLESLPIDELKSLLDALELDATRRAKVSPVLPELEHRLRYLLDVGLDYLSLGRQARTLSGGETQRVRLGAALGSALSRTLYVLDEPTVGLHAVDTQRAIEVMRQLCARGNTTVVVEHDPEVAATADHLLVLGPAGGEEGGELLYEGPPAQFFHANSSYFSALSDPSSIRAATPRVRDANGEPRDALEGPKLTLRGVRQHNLDLPRLDIPLDRLVVLTGVSGSGKSTLVEDVLWKRIEREQGRAVDEPGQVDEIDGLDQITSALLLGQDPLGRSSRSTVVSFAGALDPLRSRLARTPRAKSLKLGPGAFSFNVAGGRCEICKGMGRVALEMLFMADVEITCEACRGRRFREAVLEVTWRGRNILQMLDLTVREAMVELSDISGVSARLEPLVEVGLEYLRLGQSTSTLSGGEAQRLKIASILAEGRTGERRLYLLDEPTAGLHPRDVERLLRALRALVRAGHAVLVVEHQLDLIRAADWVIDLGPGGGRHGGRLVYAGPVPGLVECRQSVTGAALRGAQAGRCDARTFATTE